MNFAPRFMTMTAAFREWLEQFRRRETVRYFAGKGAYLLPVNAAALVVGLFSTVLYARFLSPEQYGQFAYVIALITALNFLGLPGMRTAFTQAAARNQDGLFARGTRLRLRWSLLGSVVVAGLAAVCWRSKGAEVGLALAIGAVLFPFYWALDGYAAVLSGKKQFGTLAAFRLISLVLTAAVTWVTLILTQRVVWMFLANFGTVAVLNIVFMVWTHRRYRANDDHASESVGYGKRMSWLSILISIEARVDAVVLGTWLPFQQLGWFNMASRLNDALMKETWTVVAQLLFPRLAETTPEEAHRRARVWGAYLWGAFLVGGAAFLAAAPWVLPWVLGDKYRETIRLAQWLVAIHAVSVPWSVFEVWAQARTFERGLWISRLAVTGVHLATLPWCVAKWGLPGVFGSIITSRLACLATCAALFRRARV